MELHIGFRQRTNDKDEISQTKGVDEWRLERLLFFTFFSFWRGFEDLISRCCLQTTCSLTIYFYLFFFFGDEKKKTNDSRLKSVWRFVWKSLLLARVFCALSRRHVGKSNWKSGERICFCWTSCVMLFKVRWSRIVFYFSRRSLRWDLSSWVDRRSCELQFTTVDCHVDFWSFSRSIMLSIAPSINILFISRNLCTTPFHNISFPSAEWPRLFPSYVSTLQSTSSMIPNLDKRRKKEDL